LGPGGYDDCRILAAAAKALTPFAGPAVFRFDMALTPEMGEGIGIAVDLEPDCTAPSPVSTVGAAFDNEFFGMKGDASRAPFSGAESQLHIVYEHFLPLKNILAFFFIITCGEKVHSIEYFLP
jgi:hypothetical protein